MKTECVIIGQEEKKKIPINFSFVLKSGEGSMQSEFFLVEAKTSSSSFKKLELICSDYFHSGFDLIFAMPDDDIRSSGLLYLGYWNDGFVEEV